MRSIGSIADQPYHRRSRTTASAELAAGFIAQTLFFKRNRIPQKARSDAWVDPQAHRPRYGRGLCVQANDVIDQGRPASQSSSEPSLMSANSGVEK
ncbi:hypothetical protein GGR60_003436 [Xanthomonas arboricola]|nr:hypothetical protein [Xanthomonas euroxanthea]NJC38882.1 hypothetical protein [Xanthomonas euroxanthea]SYZ53319.1 hypothetical protein CPBF367_13860 [Xanthomonas arboricola pv. juglandis]